MKKRVLSLLLALCLLVTVLPVTALAADGAAEIEIQIGDAAANSMDSLAAAIAAANADKSDAAITITIGEGTATATANEQFRIERDNVTIKGAGKNATTIECGSYSCSGQAGILVSGDHVTIEDLKVTSTTDDGNVAPIKVTNVADFDGLPLVEDTVIRNVELRSQAGSALNLHGVKNALVDGVNAAEFGKCGISLASAVNVTVQNTTIAEDGWGSSIGMMYKANNSAYETPVSLIIGEGNSFPGTIYSERDDEQLDSIQINAAFGEGKIASFLNALNVTAAEGIDADSFMLNQAKIGSTYYATLEDAIDAATASDVVELVNDVDLTNILFLDKSITLQGNHHTITNTANRIIRLTQPNLDVKIYNCDLISKCTAGSDVRGISFDDTTSGSSLLLDGCKLSASFYAINIMAKPENLSVTIRNGSVAAGWAAINSYSNNSTFFIENSQLTGINDKGESSWNNFATIVFDGFGLNTADNIGKYGSNNTVQIINSTVKASTESSNGQDWLSLQYGATGNKVYVDRASHIVDDDGNDVSEAVFVHYRTGSEQNPGPEYNPNHFVSVEKTSETYQIWAPVGNTITLPDAPSKSGYTFAGWSDGTGVYPAAGTYTMREDDTVTLTAQWNVISGGGSSSGSTTETVTNPDGSTTTTVTKPDGTTTETTTDTEGNKTQVVTKPDGSSTTTVSNKDGSSSTTTVSKDGQVEAEVKLPADMVSDAAEKNETVALPMPEVPVTTDSDEAPTVTVRTGSNGSARVLIPVEDVTPGTVAILVNDDGTEEVVKTSITTEDGVVLTVENGDTVKIVDNAIDFVDVKDTYWGTEEIDFVTSRELFTGTSKTTFSPENTMTRAMIVTVLARYEGVDTTTGDEWYEAGAAWAVENGISDGTNLEASITREQLVTMLYRYAGEPAVSGTVTGFPDADDVSSYAEDAMVWALENGLINGMTDGTLNPDGTATRAQVAAILSRFVANIG